MTPRHLRRTALRSGLLSAAILVGGFLLCLKFGIGEPSVCMQFLQYTKDLQETLETE